MWSYNQKIEPPAPFIDVIIRHPLDVTLFRDVPAKLDTGADITGIPEEVAFDLGLVPSQSIVTEGYDGSRMVVDTYAVTIEVNNARFRMTNVILIPDKYALLGRDLLNYFYISLNGPDLTLDLTLSRP